MRLHRRMVGFAVCLRADAKGFDKLFTALHVPLIFVVPSVAGLDAVRFGWSSMPLDTVWPGVFLFLLATVPVVRAMRPTAATG